ncbi:hypothetical protein ES703_56963 [subsurface metagenome]
MNIPKAIEILTTATKLPNGESYSSYQTAIKLGIEALKWRQHCEAVGYVETCDPLPGETKD